jgi:hypothetical protein
MRVAFGFKAHSGWAALTVVGRNDAGTPVLVDRRRIELVEERWAKQPYHAAEDLEPQEARDVVMRGIAEAHRVALGQLQAAVQREKARGNQVAACAVLVGAGMPSWSTDEILAVHFRMHKAEGVLFRDALTSAAAALGLHVSAVPEKELGAMAEARGVLPTLAAMGKSAGPPWGKDQKDAALAALLALTVKR